MTELKEIISQLMLVLKDQLEAYKELLNLAKDKTDILIKGDVKLLEEITCVEQNLILTLGKLEEERCSIVLKLAQMYKKDVDEVKHDFIAKLLPREEAEAFSKINKELKDVIGKVQESNKINGRLIRQALEYIEFSIELLTDAGDNKTNYSADGVRTQETIHFIDKKA